MTSMELIDALEDIDEAFIVEGAPAKKRAAFPVVARRWIAVAACLLLSAGIGFGAWRLQETAPIPENSEEESTVTTTTEGTTATTQKPTESTTPPTTGTTDWEGQGGSGYGASYVYVGDDKHSGMKNYFGEFIRNTYGQDKINEAIAERNAERNATSYSYTGSSMHRWIRVFNIPKEAFVEVNNRSKESFKDNEWDLAHYTYTDEEINDFQPRIATVEEGREIIYDIGGLSKNLPAEDILWLQDGYVVRNNIMAGADAE